MFSSTVFSNRNMYELKSTCLCCGFYELKIIHSAKLEGDHSRRTGRGESRGFTWETP
jgi:hypothetical protein